MEPNTLQDAILFFASPDNCREYLGKASLAQWRDVPALRRHEGSVSSKIQPLAVWQQARPETVHSEDWHNL